MLQKSKSPLKIYYTQCGNWENAVKATSAWEACKKSIAEAKKNTGDNLNFTDLIVSMDLQKEIDGEENSREAFISNQFI